MVKLNIHWQKVYYYIKAYKDNKLIFKAIIENTLSFPKDKFSLAKESLNQICLFQTEIKVETSCFVPFSDYKDVLYKSRQKIKCLIICTGKN